MRESQLPQRAASGSLDSSPEPQHALPRMRRREFLQRTTGGFLLTVLAARTASGAAAEDVTLSSDGLSLTLRVPQEGSPQLRSLKNPRTGFEWCHPEAVFEPVLVPAAGPQTGWTLQRASTTPGSATSRLEFVVRHEASAVDAHYVLRAIADAPVVDVRVGFHNTGASSLKGVTAFGSVRFRLRDDLGELRVHQEGGPIVIEAVGTGEFLLVGIEWGGATCRIEEGSTGRWLNLELRGQGGLAKGANAPPLTRDLQPGERLPAPRVFLGVARGDIEDAFLTAQHYLKRHVFPAPPEQWPWVAYNIYPADSPPGIEEALLREIDFAAELGVELLIHDALWYEGTLIGTNNWGAGLGHYTDDRRKYPKGLAALSRRVHEKGMKFGLWVGPNIVDPRVVGSLVKPEWLCKVDGQLQIQGAWGPENAPVMVCLGCPGYVEHLKTELSGMIRRYHVDLLRWDDSGMNGACNRTDHGHQAGDWAYAWQQGQYEVFEHLRAKFPSLIIELARGPNFGAARTVLMQLGDYTASDAADYGFPSSFFQTWITQPVEGDDAALDTLYRRRMCGMFAFALGGMKLSTGVSHYPAPMLAAARRNIPVYKQYRHLLNYDCHHLTPAGASTVTASASWLVKQFVSPSGDQAAVVAFRNDSPRADVRVPLRALDERRNYELTSVNTKARTVARGADLLRDGLALSLARPDMSEIILLRASP